MCSTREARIAAIGAAIDEVAAAARACGAGHADVTDLTDRLASIWAMVAELDPALAARLRNYISDTK
jgi:ABC-type transporter Mla subunit MlaD